MRLKLCQVDFETVLEEALQQGCCMDLKELMMLKSKMNDQFILSLEERHYTGNLYYNMHFYVSENAIEKVQSYMAENEIVPTEIESVTVYKKPFFNMFYSILVAIGHVKCEKDMITYPLSEKINEELVDLKGKDAVGTIRKVSFYFRDVKEIDCEKISKIL